MRRLIPPKTRRDASLHKDFTYKDLFVMTICVCVAGAAVSSDLAILKWFLMVLSLGIGFCLILPWGRYFKGYDWFFIIQKYIFSKKKYKSKDTKKLLDYKSKEGIIELYGKYTAVLELMPVEFLLFKQSTQEQIIAQLANALRYINNGSIIKIERPIVYSEYIERYKHEIQKITDERTAFFEAEKAKVVKKKKAFDASSIDLTSYDVRIEILEKNILFLEYINDGKKIKAEVFYLALYENSKEKLLITIKDTLSKLYSIGLAPRSLSSDEIDSMLQFFVYKKEAEKFEFPSIKVNKKSILIEDEEYKIATIGKFPVFAEGNCWSSSLFTIPGTNVVLNFGIANKDEVVKSVNKSIKEIKFRYLSEKDASGQQDLQIQKEALLLLLQQFQLGNEGIHNTNFYIMYQEAQEDTVKQTFHSQGFILNNLPYMQFDGFVSMLPLCGKEMLPRASRHLQSSTLAASFPFINNLFMDKNGDYLGDFRYPVFFDIWERAPYNKNRMNSNLCILGQSGGGKTFVIKKILMQQRVHGIKVFVLDCEHEYPYMASKLGGQTIEMSGGSKINPFQVYPSEEAEEEEISGDVSSQCSFLSEWFKCLLNMDIDCKSKLDTLIVEVYQNANLTDETDLSKIKNKDFPTFDTLFALIKNKSKKKEIGDYEKATLQKLENYLSSFVGNGIYARLWNGTTTFNINNDFTIFDFQKLFSNSNKEVCNAQMLMLMRLLMREVINVKNSNELTGKKDRVIVLVDEAHRYISAQFMIALDTLEQFARRIRKYDGALIVATQSIDDFIGTSEEMRTKASAVINNCQYSMLFGLKADDINKVQKLYSNYGGGLTSDEVDFLTRAELGQMLFLVEPEKRSVVTVGLMPDEKIFIERSS